MTTEVSICNLALAHVGDTAKVAAIDGSDTSAQAAHCARFYPLARGVALEAHDWAFATRRAQLSQVVIDPAFYPEAQYAYALPAAYKRMIGLINSTLTDYAYRVESIADGSSILLTDCPPEEMFIRYCVEVTDASKFNGAFILYLSYILAEYLSGPLRKADKVQGLQQSARAALMRASGTDAKVDSFVRHKRAEHRPPWIRAR